MLIPVVFFFLTIFENYCSLLVKTFFLQYPLICDNNTTSRLIFKLFQKCKNDPDEVYPILDIKTFYSHYNLKGCNKYINI